LVPKLLVDHQGPGVSRLNCSSGSIRGMDRRQLMRDHEARPADVSPSAGREDRGHDRRHPCVVLIQSMMPAGPRQLEMRAVQEWFLASRLPGRR
jgi:hypothetical protein